MAHDIFISYSRRDEAYVRLLCSYLEEFGKRIIPFRIATLQASFPLVHDLLRLHRIDTDEGSPHPFLLELTDKMEQIEPFDEGPANPKASPESRFVCVSGRDVTPEMILQAMAIDAKVYSDCFHGDYGQCLAWWRRNPEIYVMVRDAVAGKVVGYVNAMPLCDELYDRIRTGE